MIVNNQSYFLQFLLSLFFVDWMKSITLVILLSICTTSSGLSCVNGSGFLVKSLNGFDNDRFQEEIRNLSTITLEDKSLCRVKLELHHEQKRLIVVFNRNLANSELNKSMVEFALRMEPSSFGNMANFKINNYLEYACSNDECDKQFIIDHIGWLYKNTYTELKEQFDPLLRGNATKTDE